MVSMLHSVEPRRDMYKFIFYWLFSILNYCDFSGLMISKIILLLTLFSNQVLRNNK